MENVLKVKDEWVNKTNSGKAVMELDINDYPLTARARIMSRDYLNTINDLTHCNVLVRGSYIDSGRKSVIG